MTEKVIADDVLGKGMSTDNRIALARDQPVGDKPEATSEEDFRLFEARRRMERAQVDVDENRLTPQERRMWATKQFERGGR